MLERNLSAYELMVKGYDKTEKEQENGKVLEVIQKDKKEERFLTAIEKLMNGYNEDSTQRNKEVVIDPNDIKENKEEGK